MQRLITNTEFYADEWCLGGSGTSPCTIKWWLSYLSRLRAFSQVLRRHCSWPRIGNQSLSLVFVRTTWEADLAGSQEGGSQGQERGLAALCPRTPQQVFDEHPFFHQGFSSMEHFPSTHLWAFFPMMERSSYWSTGASQITVLLD